MNATATRLRERADRLAGRRRTVWWAVFAAVFAMAALWSFASPLSSSPDEPSHLAYAAAIWHGDLVGTDLVPGDPGFPAERAGVARTITAGRVPAWVANVQSQPNCYAFYDNIPASCSPAIGSSTDLVTVFYPFGRYPPTYYALVGWPTTFLSGDTAYHAVRLVSAALCAAMVATATTSAVALARRRRVAVLGVALGVTPLAMFLFGTVTSSALEIAVALLLWLAGIELLTRAGPPSPWLVAKVVVAGTLLAWTRPGGFAYLGAIGIVLLVAALSRERARELLHTRSTQVGLGLLGLAAAGGAAWLVLRQPDKALLGVPLPGVSSSEAARHSLSLLPERAKQMVGIFGWLDTPLPGWASVGWLLLVGAAVIAALLLGTNRQRIALVVSGAIVVMVPTVLEVRAVPDVGYVWQGRYTLPLALAFPVLACWTIGDRARARHDRALAVGAAVVVVFVVVVQFVAHARALDRYVGGLPGGLLDYVDDAGWRPPLGRKGQLVAGVGATALWGVVLAWLALGHRTADDPPPTGGPGGPGTPEAADTADTADTGVHAGTGTAPQPTT